MKGSATIRVLNLGTARSRILVHRVQGMHVYMCMDMYVYISVRWHYIL